MLVAVFAALASGLLFAVGSVLQQSAASEAPAETSLSWRLLLDLFQRRRWLLGIGADVVSFGLQALALGFGPIALVQPILVTGLLFSVPLSLWHRKRRMGRQEWLGTVSVAGGLAAFLAAASPTEGEPQTSGFRWVVVIVTVGGIMLVATAVGRTLGGRLRPTLYGLAAGTSFGLLAALTKTSTWLLGRGIGTFFTAWEPYALAVVAALGMIVQQSAYQSGPLAASVPVMDATEPTSAVLIGVFAFAEHLGHSAGAVVLEAVGVAAVLAGIVTLDRSPAVLALQRSAADERPSGAGADGTDEAQWSAQESPRATR